MMKGRPPLSAFALAALLLCTLSACGAGGNETAASVAYPPQMNDALVSYDKSVPMTEMQMEDSSAISGDNASSAKLIRRGVIGVETMEFEAAVASLSELMAQYDGYYQSTHLYTSEYSVQNGNRSAEYMIRIPAEHFESFTGEMGTLGTVHNQHTEIENITQIYRDTEHRLKTQETKHERLLDLLSKAETMEDIISLENALSETEYQIDSLTSTLNQYDNLTGYATIELYIYEITQQSTMLGYNATLGERLSLAFAEGVVGFRNGATDLLVWMVRNLFVLIIFAAVIVLMVYVSIRSHKRIKAVKPAADQKADKDGSERKD